MNDAGMISYDGWEIMMNKIGKCTTEYFSAPVFGSIHCGISETEEECVEEYVSLLCSVFGQGNLFLLKTKGDSMTDAGIDAGDLIVTRTQETAATGDMVVALDENTLKIFGRIDEETGDVIQHYANRRKYPKKEIRVQQLIVQGVAKHVIKALQYRPLQFIRKGCVLTMETYDVRCPVCGAQNHDLYLEETGGWMECDYCHQAVQILKHTPMKKIPVYTGRQLAEKLASARE